jgi:hypothetical protein
MKARILFSAVLALAAPLAAQQAQKAWQYYQDLAVNKPGVYMHRLPPEALDRSLPGLEDLRLFDAAGREVPYLLEAPRPELARLQPLANFKARLEGSRTVLTAAVPAGNYVDSVLAESPAGSFIKPADVYVSMDGDNWTKLAAGAPLFRQYCNSENLRVDVPATPAKFVKVAVDDGRSGPVPFTGLRARLLPRVPPELQSAGTQIISREDSASSSRITVRLPARNLYVFAVQLAVPDKLFSRAVTVSVRSLENGALVSRQLAADTIFATDAAGSSAARTKVAVYAQFQGSDELVLDVDNGNSPPLTVNSVSVTYAPVNAVFQAKAAGVFRLAFGNRQAQRRSYDLAGLSGYLTGKNFAKPQAGQVTANPGYAPAEPLPALDTLGAAIDVSKWSYKAAVSVERRGVEALDLSVPVLSRLGGDLRDLRLVSGGRQVPYILDRDYALRGLPAEITKAEGRTAGFYAIKLPCDNFPLKSVAFSVPNGVFQRQVTLYDPEPPGGGRDMREIGSAVWTNDGHNADGNYSISVNSGLSGRELLLRVQDGDNNALELSGVKLYYPVSRLIFKWTGDAGLWLYYGNPQAGYPQYDIALVAQELLNAEKQTARLEGEAAGNSDWGSFRLSSGLAKAAFWAVLAAVAALLIVLIVKLLPPVEKK